MIGASDPNGALNFAQYGVLGLIVLGFITGKIVAGYLLDRAEARLAERDAVIEKMRMSMEEKTVPALIRSTETLAEVADLLATLTKAQQRRPPASGGR